MLDIGCYDVTMTDSDHPIDTFVCPPSFGFELNAEPEGDLEIVQTQYGKPVAIILTRTEARRLAEALQLFLDESE